MSWFVAKYKGECSECSCKIKEGDEVRMENGKIYCEECGKDLH